MKIKVRGQIYDASETPIMVILTDKDKENIANMLPECTKYAQFADGTSVEDMANFMADFPIRKVFNKRDDGFVVLPWAVYKETIEAQQKPNIISNGEKYIGVDECSDEQLAALHEEHPSWKFYTVYEFSEGVSQLVDKLYGFASCNSDYIAVDALTSDEYLELWNYCNDGEKPKTDLIKRFLPEAIR